MERIEGNKKVKGPCIYPDIIVNIARNTGASFLRKKTYRKAANDVQSI